MSNTKRLKLAFYGGSFNPIHNGHITVAHDVIEQFEFDQFYFVPVSHPPLKHAPDMVADSHRLKMLELALKPYPYFKIFDLEIKTGGISYTYSTVQKIKEEYPHATIYWVIGADQVLQLHKWHKYEELCKEIEFIAMLRPGDNEVSLNAHTQAVIHWVNTHLLQISSTEIRHRILQGRPVEFFLPNEVYSYIQKHKLYIK